MRTTLRRREALLMAMLAAMNGTAFAQAEGRPVRIVVPGPAGTAMDAYLRAISAPFHRITGQTMIVENLPGAGGTLATAQVARAAPDGLTLQIVSSNHVINPSLFKSLPYDTLASFDPIAVIGVVPVVLVVSPTIQARTVSDLIASIKTAPKGSFNYGSLGIGTVLHLAGELFDTEAGVKTVHVPYRDAGALTGDLISGTIQMAYLALPSVSQLVKTGKIRALALTTPEPSSALPGVPSMSDTLPNYAIDVWLALIAPKGVPAPMIDKYYAAVKACMQDAAVKEAIAAQGLAPLMMPPAETRKFMRAEQDKYAALVQRSGAQPQ